MLGRRIEELEALAHVQAGRPFNVGSPQEVRRRRGSRSVGARQWPCGCGGKAGAGALARLAPAMLMPGPCPPGGHGRPIPLPLAGLAHPV